MSREISTCRVCKKNYWQGNIEGAKDICNDCKQKQWFAEMKAKGCTVGDFENLGREPQLVRVKKHELPKVIVNGDVYTDITTTLYTDGRHKKIFYTDEEWEEIKKAEFKKRQYKRKKKRIAEDAAKRKAKEEEVKKAEKEMKKKIEEATKASEEEAKRKEISRKKSALENKKREARNELILQLREKGFTYKEIANRLGIGLTTVGTVVNKKMRIEV